jgi:hypothetical protein
MPEGEPRQEQQNPIPEAEQPTPVFESVEQPEISQQETQSQSSPDIRLGKGNCHDVLGLPANASEQQIGHRFRELAMKYHPDHGGDPDDFKMLMGAYNKAKEASANGGESGVAPEAVVVAGAGVAASGMRGVEISPQQRQSILDAMFAANDLASKESEFNSRLQEQERNAQHEARMKEIDEDYARRKAKDAQFNERVAEMQRKIDAEIDAEKAAEKAEQERMHSYVFSSTGPDEFARDIQMSAIKSIIMPLTESGLLSQQEMNEFMAVGRAIQIDTFSHAPTPEKPAQQERQERVEVPAQEVIPTNNEIVPQEQEQNWEAERNGRTEAILNPRYENSSVFYEEIDKNIYAGEKDPEKRVAKIEEHGYSADQLRERGQDIMKELQEIFDENVRNGGKEGELLSISKSKREYAETLRGLVFSQTGEGLKDFVRHSDLSIGLAYELSRQMRKIAQTEAQPNSDRVGVRDILRQSDVPATDDTVNKIIEHGAYEFFARKPAIMENISAGAKTKQYETAFNVLESSINAETGQTQKNNNIQETRQTENNAEQERADKELAEAEELRQKLNEMYGSPEAQQINIGAGIPEKPSEEKVEQPDITSEVAQPEKENVEIKMDAAENAKVFFEAGQEFQRTAFQAREEYLTKVADIAKQQHDLSDKAREDYYAQRKIVGEEAAYKKYSEWLGEINKMAEGRQKWAVVRMTEKIESSKTSFLEARDTFQKNRGDVENVETTPATGQNSVKVEQTPENNNVNPFASTEVIAGQGIPLPEEGRQEVQTQPSEASPKVEVNPFAATEIIVGEGIPLPSEKNNEQIQTPPAVESQPSQPLENLVATTIVDQSIPPAQSENKIEENQTPPLKPEQLVTTEIVDQSVPVTAPEGNQNKSVNVEPNNIERANINPLATTEVIVGEGIPAPSEKGAEQKLSPEAKVLQESFIMTTVVDQSIPVSAMEKLEQPVAIVTPEQTRQNFVTSEIVSPSVPIRAESRQEAIAQPAPVVESNRPETVEQPSINTAQENNAQRPVTQPESATREASVAQQSENTPQGKNEQPEQPTQNATIEPIGRPTQESISGEVVRERDVYIERNLTPQKINSVAVEKNTQLLEEEWSNLSPREQQRYERVNNVRDLAGFQRVLMDEARTSAGIENPADFYALMDAGYKPWEIKEKGIIRQRVDMPLRTGGSEEKPPEEFDSFVRQTTENYRNGVIETARQNLDTEWKEQQAMRTEFLSLPEVKPEELRKTLNDINLATRYAPTEQEFLRDEGRHDSMMGKIGQGRRLETIEEYNENISEANLGRVEVPNFQTLAATLPFLGLKQEEVNKVVAHEMTHYQRAMQMEFQPMIFLNFFRDEETKVMKCRPTISSTISPEVARRISPQELRNRIESIERAPGNDMSARDKQIVGALQNNPQVGQQINPATGQQNNPQQANGQQDNQQPGQQTVQDVTQQNNIAVPPIGISNDLANPTQTNQPSNQRITNSRTGKKKKKKATKKSKKRKLTRAKK